MTRDDEHRAIMKIYDTVTAPGKWRHALDSLSGIAESKALLMVVRGKAAGQRDISLMSSVYLEFSRTLRGMQYGLTVGRHQKADWDYLAGRPVLAPTPDTAMAPAAVLDRRGDYAYLRKKLGIGRRVGARLNPDRLWFDALSLGYDAGLDAAPEAGLGRAAGLLPHVAKAAELGRVFMQLRARENAALAALDRVRAGLAAAAATGEILTRNAAFARLVGAGDGLSLGRDGRLRCADPDAQAALKAACAAAAAVAAGEERGAPEICLPIPRRGGGAPLLLDVAPLRDGAAELERGLSGVLLTLVDPDAPPTADAARFARAYALTNAEAEVLALVLQGMSVREIAETRDVAAATAKNQVSALLRKSGCARREDLIRLVLRTMPPVD